MDKHAMMIVMVMDIHSQGTSILATPETGPHRVTGRGHMHLISVRPVVGTKVVIDMTQEGIQAADMTGDGVIQPAADCSFAHGVREVLCLLHIAILSAFCRWLVSGIYAFLHVCIVIHRLLFPVIAVSRLLMLQQDTPSAQSQPWHLVKYLPALPDVCGHAYAG